MVLCAGYGTRLRPLSAELPKPLLPVGDRALLAHIAARLASSEFSEVVVNTHHLPREFSRIHQQLPVNLEVVHEPEILGTAGGVRGALGLLGGPPVVVWNGDVIADVPLAELGGRAGAWACLAVRRRARGEGTLGLAAEGCVVRLRGECFGVEATGADYLGIAALGPLTLASLPVRGCLVGDVWLPALRGGAAVATLEVGGAWTDIGDLPGYLAANLAWVRDQGRGSWVGPGATVAGGVQLVDAVIGAGARVEGEGIVEQAVAWPGATLRAPASRVVVTSRGTLVKVEPVRAT